MCPRPETGKRAYIHITAFGNLKQTIYTFLEVLCFVNTMSVRSLLGFLIKLQSRILFST